MRPANVGAGRKEKWKTYDLPSMQNRTTRFCDELLAVRTARIRCASIFLFASRCAPVAYNGTPLCSLPYVTCAASGFSACCYGACCTSRKKEQVKYSCRSGAVYCQHPGWRRHNVWHTCAARSIKLNRAATTILGSCVVSSSWWFDAHTHSNRIAFSLSDNWSTANAHVV